MPVNQVLNQKTIQQIIDESSKNTGNRKTGELGKDDFLNLLVTQLRYQDPLKPVDDKEFIAQMAQFTSLEQMQNMNSTLSKSHAFSMIGKQITANVSDADTKEMKIVEGLAESVKLSGGKTYVVVNGEDIPADKIVKVAVPDLSSKISNLAQYTGLIGYSAKGIIYNPSTSEMLTVNGVIKSLQMGLYEDYAVMDGVEVEISEIITDFPSTDPDFVERYLSDHMPPKDNKVSVVVIDRATGHKVPVTAYLRSYQKINDNYKLVLDGLQVPVEGIVNITLPVQEQEKSSGTIDESNI